ETPLPREIGHEPAGVVEAVGTDVTEWKPGDRVAGLFGVMSGGFGAFATYAKATADWLVRVPDHVPLEHAIVEPVKCIVTGLRAVGAEVHFAEPGHCLDPVDELRRAMDGIARGVFPMERLITHRYGLHEVTAGMEAALARTPGFVKGIVVPDGRPS